MQIPGYVGICAACFWPIKDGELSRLRPTGRKFHEKCSKDNQNYYVKLEKRRLERERRSTE